MEVDRMTTGQLSGVNIRLFGGFELVCPGKPLEDINWQAGQAALIAFLALQTKPRDSRWIAAQFWPPAESEIDRALDNLRHLVGDVRQKLRDKQLSDHIELVTGGG